MNNGNYPEQRIFAKRKNLSNQPRFMRPTPEAFLTSTYNWVKKAEGDEPNYQVNSRKRDMWLRDFVRYEPHLAGVMNTVVDIDKNRGWRLVGGRNQVLSYTDLFHGYTAAPGMRGWRPGLSVSSQAFWGSDLGAVVEFGRETRNGPVRELYTVDPGQCQLTGNGDTPIRYYSSTGAKSTYFRWNDFMRISSLPSSDEKLHGLGFCAVSRSLELAKLMIAIFQHDKEQLGTQAPRGLLLLKGISENQWRKAMSARDTELEENELDYFDPVAVLASNAQNVDAKLVALSQLPAEFNLREWMDMLMYGYALIFGYDPSEFWPVQYGALGRGTEGTLQHEKATGKGRLDFVLGFQEQIQEFLPITLAFEFEQKDEQGELLNAQIHAAWATVAKTLYEAGQTTMSGSLIRWGETRALLSEWGMIPRSWAPIDEIEATDTENPDDDPAVDKSNPTDETGKSGANTVKPQQPQEPQKPENAKATPGDGTAKRRVRDLLLSIPTVYRAAIKFPAEPIVRYDYPANVVTQLWESGDDLLHRRSW